MKTRWQHGLSRGRPGESAHATGGFGRSDALGILLANLAVLGLSLWQGLPAACLVWPYWCQSAVIGLFHHRRILALQRFSTEGFTSNDRPVPVTEQAKRETALFFALHYGFFHAMFLLFLAALAWPAAADWKWIALGALGFGASQALTQRARLAADAAAVPNLGAMLFLPYLRVLPIALSIGFIGYLHESGGAVLLFGLIKTGADVLGAMGESNLTRRGTDARDGPA